MKKTLLWPHTCPQPSSTPTPPSARRCSLSLSLSFEPKSNSVSGYEKVSTTTCNQTYERGSIYSFLVLSSMPPLVRNFTQYELYVFKGLLFPPPFFVKEWLNSKTVADNSHFFQSRSSQHVSFLEEKLHTDDNKIKSADSFSKPPPFPSHPSRSQNELTWEENKGALGIVESVDIRTACGDFPVDEDCLTRGKYLFRSNWERNNTAAKTSA